jgi:two-component system cell cycle sensor histidine kinase/response regulator CckA
METNKPLASESTVLLAESDNSLRQLVGDPLTREGYRVLFTSDGKQALHIAARHDYDIDLLLTDVILPGFYGWHLAELLKLDYPQLKVIYLASCPDCDARTERNTYALACDSKVIRLHESDCADTLVTAVRDVLSSRESSAPIGTSSDVLSDAHGRRATEI